MTEHAAEPARLYVITEAEEAAIRRWAERQGLPTKRAGGRPGLPWSLISQYGIALLYRRVRSCDYPVYGEDEEMSAVLVSAWARQRWEAKGSPGRIRPADCVQPEGYRP
jgi:hypothetical protein